MNQIRPVRQIRPIHPASALSALSRMATKSRMYENHAFHAGRERQSGAPRSPPQHGFVPL